MSAFRRRTRFATPVIVTVAACSSAKDKPKPEPHGGFPVTWQVVMNDMKCAARIPGANPPPPAQAIECPPGMTGHVYMTVGKIAEGKCAVVPQGCTEPICAKPITPCPLPPGQAVVNKLAYVWVIEKRGDKCHA